MAIGKAAVFVSGEVLDHQKMNDAVGAVWQTFTPSWGNVTLGNGTSEGWYRFVGDSMEIRAQLTCGSTTAFTGNVYFTVPDSRVNQNMRSIGVAFLDYGTKEYVGCCYAGTGGGGSTVYLIASDSHVISTVPGTIASGYVLTAQITLEV